MDVSSRVAVNSAAQFLRSIIIMVIALWTSREVLYCLGVIDYGIINLIGGIVAFLGSIRGNLASATQRFLSFYQEKRNGILGKVFDNSVIVQLTITICLCFCLLILTPIVFSVLNIPEDKLESSRIVYFTSIGGLFMNMMCVPYVAALISRENIVLSSIIQVLDTVLKIPVVLSLYYIKYEKIEYYSYLLLVIYVINFICYFYYCTRKYNECRCFSISNYDRHFFLEIFRFTGWDMYGTTCYLARKQGIDIILNRFFSVAINSAYAIGYQVATYMDTLSTSILVAMRPQIVKSESSGNRKRAFRLAEIASKFAFLLLSIVTIPLSLSLNVVLKMWLVEIPEYTELFCVTFLIALQLNLLTNGLVTVNQAVGHVKRYHLSISTIRLLSLPIVFISLLLYQDPLCVTIVYLGSEMIFSLGRVAFLHFDIGYSVTMYCRNVLFSCIPVIVFNFVFCYFVSRLMPNIYGVALSGVASVSLTILITYFWGLRIDEREMLENIMRRFCTFLKKSS